MKIEIRRTHKGNVSMEIDGRQMIVTIQEMADVIDGTRHVIDDCGKLLKADFAGLTLIENPNNYSDERGTVKYVRMVCDADRFFKRVWDLLDRCIITEDKHVTVDTDSFRHKAELVEPLGFAQIARHPKFHALDKLKEALVIAPRDEMFKLRDILRMKISQGMEIYTDFTKGGFFFRGSYVGGIIFHDYSKSYSVHT